MGIVVAGAPYGLSKDFAATGALVEGGVDAGAAFHCSISSLKRCRDEGGISCMEQTGYIKKS